MNHQILRDILNARPRAFAFLAFLIVLNAALLLYLSARQRPELEKVQKEWFARREAQAGRQGAGVASEYQRGVRDLALFQKRYIAKREFPAFLGRLFQSGKNHSLTVSQVSYKPTPVKEHPNLLAYGIGFTVSGTYPAIKSFIAEVEGYPEMVTLDSLALTNTSAIEESVQLKVQLTAYLTTEGR